jgi:hypothetical protein
MLAALRVFMIGNYKYKGGVVCGGKMVASFKNIYDLV